MERRKVGENRISIILSCIVEDVLLQMPFQ